MHGPVSYLYGLISLSFGYNGSIIMTIVVKPYVVFQEKLPIHGNSCVIRKNKLLIMKTPYALYEIYKDLYMYILFRYFLG